MSLLWRGEETKLVLSAEVPEGQESLGVQPRSDECLMTALKSRDNKEALDELFRRYWRLVFSIGLRILRNAAEAEEIVQDVFLYLFEKAALFDESKGGAKSWLVQIAHHRSLDRQEYLHRRNFYFGTDTGVLTDTLAGPGDLERDLASKESRQRLQEAFENLTDQQRKTLELFFFEDLSFPEITERIGESLENVRHHYYRGIQKLRKDAFVKKLRDKK